MAPSAIFLRLNTYMERCMDALEFTQTYVHFFKLDKMVSPWSSYIKL